MKVQENQYLRAKDHTILRITSGDQVRAAIKLDHDAVHTISQYKWSYRGKGVIVNKLGTTLGYALCQLYGYDYTYYSRAVANDDYTKANIIDRRTVVLPVVDVPTNKPVIEVSAPIPHRDLGVSRLQRTKWRDKYQCETVSVKVLVDGSAPIMQDIKINTFCRPYIPDTLVLREFHNQPDLLCLDGTPLRIWLLEELDSSLRIRTKFGCTLREDPYDYRVDPNDVSYISHRGPKPRFHYTDEGVVIEILEEGSVTRFGWPVADRGIMWRAPVHYTKCAPRVAYVIVDENVVDLIDDIWYNANHDVWMVRDTLNTAENKWSIEYMASRPLKKLVCIVNSVPIEDIYFQPRLTASYKRALEATESVDTQEGRRAARTRAKYENRIGSGDTSHGAMFTKPQYVSRRHIITDQQYFCPSIYGGVGVWCSDHRFNAIHVKGLQAPEQDLRHRKDVRE